MSEPIRDHQRIALYQREIAKPRSLYEAGMQKDDKRPSIQNQPQTYMEGVGERVTHLPELMKAEVRRWSDMDNVEKSIELGTNLINPEMGALVGAVKWHGSPHLFKKFKKEAIGTGEGAQAYGHGLYLAENPAVGEEYRKNLARIQFQKTGQIEAYNHPQAVPYKKLDDAYAKGALDGYGVGLMPKEDALAMLDKSINGKAGLSDKVDIKAEVYGVGSPEHKQAIKQLNLAQKLQDQINSGEFTKQVNAGHLYKTDIPDTHIDKMLDWDKPLSEQHPDVQSAIKQLKDHPGWSRLVENQMGGPVMEQATGRDLYKALGDNQQSADVLRNAGLPGIKYLDGSSRTAGEGTRNFVMFNPDDIRILERNGVPTGEKPWADVNAAMSSALNDGTLSASELSRMSQDDAVKLMETRQPNTTQKKKDGGLAEPSMDVQRMTTNKLIQ